MNENTVKTSSCLAITDKKKQQQQRPGGCVGLFLQLFDWNKKFAKKKLFSTKLLTPARSKQGSKRFAGDEKMPKTKLQLTGDENSSGVSKKNGKGRVDIEQKHHMKTPSLVARLMGLDSMPAIHKDKLKKSAFSSSSHIKEEKVLNLSVPSGQDSNSEKGNTKLESRPQKIQRTGPSTDRRAVTRFTAESLQIKNVLSRSRKHHNHIHHSKFISPVKSPRILSSRSSRLMDAATKILEPGMHARNRAKRALMYRNSANYSTKNDLLTEKIVVISPHLVNESSSDRSRTVRACIVGQTSCNNCGNMLDVASPGQNVINEPFVYQDFASILNNANVSSRGQDSDVFHRSPEQSVFLAAQEKGNRFLHGEFGPERKTQAQEGLVYFRSKKSESKSQKDESASNTFRHNAQTRECISLSRDRTPPRPKSSFSQVQIIRVPAKVDSSTIEAQTNSCYRRDESFLQVRSPVRKRRSVGNNNRQVETVNFANSAVSKQSNGRWDVMPREKVKNGLSSDQASIKDRNGSDCNGESNVTFFKFDSPMRQNSKISTQDKRKAQANLDSHIRQTGSVKSGGHKFELSSKEDALSILLQEKLKELTSQEDEPKIGTKTTTSTRSTAMILEELINALTKEHSASHDGRIYDSQNKVKTEGSAELSHVSDHLSPESVLEASFSNDSCFSSSFDDNSVSGRHRHPFDSIDSQCDQLSTVDPDGELLDSATSSGKDRAGNGLVTDLLNQTSGLLDSIKSINLGLSGNNLAHAKEIIMHAELYFVHVTSSNSNAKHLLVSAPLLDKLVGALRTDLNRYLGFEETSDDAQIKAFLFDFLIECLESKCSRYSNSGFKAWRRILPCINSEMLIQEVGMELMKWTDVAGFVPDEIVEWETSHVSGEWIDFDIEVFEAGIKIDDQIFKMLVEEVIDEFRECCLLRCF